MFRLVRIRRRRQVKSAARAFDEANLASAGIILSDSAKYGEHGSGLCRWAETVLKRAEQHVSEHDDGGLQQSLFTDAEHGQ